MREVTSAQLWFEAGFCAALIMCGSLYELKNTVGEIAVAFSSESSQIELKWQVLVFLIFQGGIFFCRTFSDSCAEGVRHGMQCPVAELSLEVYPSSTKDRNYRIIYV